MVVQAGYQLTFSVQKVKLKLLSLTSKGKKMHQVVLELGIVTGILFLVVLISFRNKMNEKL